MIFVWAGINWTAGACFGTAFGWPTAGGGLSSPDQGSGYSHLTATCEPLVAASTDEGMGFADIEPL